MLGKMQQAGRDAGAYLPVRGVGGSSVNRLLRVVALWWEN